MIRDYLQKLGYSRHLQLLAKPSYARRYSRITERRKQESHEIRLGVGVVLKRVGLALLMTGGLAYGVHLLIS